MRSLLFAFIFCQSFFVLGSALGFSEMDHPETLTPSEKMEVLWGEYLSNNLDPLRFYSLTEGALAEGLEGADELRLMQIENSFLGNKKTMVRHRELSPKLALRIATEEALYSNLEMSFGKSALEELERARQRLRSLKRFRTKTKDEIIDLVFESPDLSDYQNARYAGGVKLFLFCRRDRSYPCLFVLKDAFDRLVRSEDGELWTMPALAKSAGNLPYYITNGHTPSGAHSIDSVMPYADQQLSFGKFRRVILNWIASDESVKEMLPQSAKNKKWWKEASLARDNGRKWLRIHGTGRLNSNRSSSYYPHVPTAGCVSVREGAYGASEYKDQRLLLDEIMKAMRMAPVFGNEPEIKGMLYVIELDKKKKRVAKETLKEYGVF